jgi:hypothetical protein
MGRTAGRIKRTKLPDHNDPSSWLSKGEAAKLIGVTRQMIRKLTVEGAFHPIRDSYGDAFFDPDEVHSYAVTHPKIKRFGSHGELAAEAFKLFQAGHRRQDCVIELRCTPQEVDELWAEWKRDDFASARAERAAQAELHERERKRDRAMKAALEAMRAMSKRNA